ncbi:Kalirin [Dactylellina cionopaga]|nr:Kalirin [Dactylellina cionopaga]
MKSNGAAAASPRVSSTISTTSSQTLVNSHASISTISSISTTSTFTASGQAGSPVVASPVASFAASIPKGNDSLINKKADGSQSLYQICMILKQRLRLIPGMDKHLDKYATDPENPDLPADPVYQVWHTFRSGAPLVLLYNTLCSEKRLDGADEMPDSLNKKKALVFRFLKNINEELHLSGEDTFIITNVYSEDTTGFVKVGNGSLAPYTTSIAEERPDLANLDKRGKTVYELLETERKYVQDLEALQDYMNALRAAEIVSNDTIHALFVNLNQLLDFQRKFLVSVETMYAMPPDDQKWGSLFRHYEPSFKVYELFCANFNHAQELAVQEAPRLNKLDHAVSRAGVGGFLIKPPQRVPRYSLLIDSILKASAKDDPRREDLEEGAKILIRINTKVNEEIGKFENAEVAEELKERVEDWKGHQLDHFGDLLLFGQFTVIKGDAKGDIEREYHIYLFERILLCCKELGANKKAKGAPKKPKLQLKGRIFMQNVTDIISLAKNGSYTLQIFWKGDPGVENFIIRQRNEELLKKWNNLLHKQVALWKREEDQSKADRANRFPTSNNEFLWTAGAEVPRQQGEGEQQAGDKFEDGDNEDAQGSEAALHGATNFSANGNQTGFPPPKQPKYPISSSTQYMQSQNTTPISAGIPTNGMSYFSPSESPMPTPRQMSGQYPFPKQGSHENGTAMARSTSREGRIPRPSPGIAQSSTQQNRMRSASSPNIPPLPAPSPLGRANAMSTPPLPNGYPSLYSQVQHLNTLPEHPRASGMVPHIGTMHQDYIPRNGTPPADATRVGGDASLPHMRQMPVPSLKVKVSYITDMFVIIVPQNIGYTQLMDRIERKVRLCGGATYSSNNPLRVRYQDEDGDYITVNSDEDVQMAIESRFNGGEESMNAVTLFVA